MSPDDQFDRDLYSQVHPTDWVNPQPAERYDLVVIGAGTAGLVTAAGAAGLGAKVALIEQHLMGGDCLNYGCVPSKALIRTARAAEEITSSQKMGIVADGLPRVSFPQVMARMRHLRAMISLNDSAERFRTLGVDVFFGQARFTKGDQTIEVADQELRYKKAVICTGARAAIPNIPGLDVSADVHSSSEPGQVTTNGSSRSPLILTNETLFQLQELPQRFAVIGGGPIGCEMAQCFARLGAFVTLYETSERLLKNDDPEASDVIREAFGYGAIDVRLSNRIESVSPQQGAVTIHSIDRGRARRDTFDAVLVATGRAPNVEGLDLEAAGIAYDKHGVTVDDRLRTTNPRVYAAGDICSRFKFTHAADFMARIVIQNALFWGRAKASQLIIPWCTYTSPEVAHVGLLPSDAEQQGIAIDTFTQPLSSVDRAILDSETDGFVKVHVRRGTDQIVGATIVAAHAGEMISEVTLAMRNGIGLKGLASTIHPYPTQADALRKIGDQYNKTRLTPFAQRLLKFLISLGR